MIENLTKKALRLRRDTFKAFVIKGEAHLGGSFSLIEILITLFYKILKKNDKFILSKSHASFPLCIILKQKGFNPKLTTHLEIDPKNYDLEGELEGTKEGWNFACSGGVSDYVKKLCKKDVRAIVMDGLEEAPQAFAKASKDHCDLLEGMACKGGCVAGPGTLANSKVAENFIKNLKIKSIEDK